MDIKGWNVASRQILEVKHFQTCMTANHKLLFTTEMPRLKAKHNLRKKGKRRPGLTIIPKPVLLHFFSHLLTVISSCLLLSGNLHTHDSLRTRDTLGRQAGRKNERTRGKKLLWGSRYISSHMRLCQTSYCT